MYQTGSCLSCVECGTTESSWDSWNPYFDKTVEEYYTKNGFYLDEGFVRPIRDAVICKGVDPETYWRCTLSSDHTGMHMYIRNGYTQKTWPQKKPGDTRRCNDVSPSYSDGTYNCTLPSGHAGSWHNAPGHEWFRVKG